MKLLLATDLFSNSNFVCDADSDIDSISNSEKVGVIYVASTSVSNLNKFPEIKPFKCSIQNSRRIVLTMESASKLFVLAQPFGVGDAIKSWFG